LPVPFRRILPFITAALLLSGCDMPNMSMPSMKMGSVTPSNTPVYNGDHSARPAPRPSLSTTTAPPPPAEQQVLAAQKRAEEAPIYNYNENGNAQRPALVTTNAPAGTSPRVSKMDDELGALQKDGNYFQDRLTALQSKNDIDAAHYFDIVASINNGLQSSWVTAHGLEEKEKVARAQLDDIGQNIDSLRVLQGSVTGAVSRGARLQEDIHSMHGRGDGAADHDRLLTMEDGVDHQVAHLTGISHDVDNEITKRLAYLRNEHLNMQTLSLAVGQRAGAASWPDADLSLNETELHPLIFIRFDRPNVNYEDALYAAMSDALRKYPNAIFDLVAVNTGGTTREEKRRSAADAHLHGQAVLKTLTSMGLPLERLRLSAATSAEVKSNEIRLYMQ
jgi:hypothetical protein